MSDLDDRIQRSAAVSAKKLHVGYPVDRIIQALRTHLDPLLVKQVIDIGSGFGRLSHAIASHFPDSQVLGLDSDEACVTYANAEAARLRIDSRCRFQCADVRDQQASRGGERRYDVAALLAVRGIFGDGAGLAAAAASYLEPGGMAIVDAAVIQVDELAAGDTLDMIARQFQQAGGSLLYSEQLVYPYSREAAVRNLAGSLEASGEIAATTMMSRAIVEHRLGNMLADVQATPDRAQVVCRLWFIRP